MEKSNALMITQQYPIEKYNLLVPMQTVAEIAEIHKPVMNVVQISTNIEDGEIYEQEKAKKAWKDYPAQPAKYALTKKGLNKLMRQASKSSEPGPSFPLPARNARRSTAASAAR